METWTAVLISASVAAITTITIQRFATRRARRTALFDAIRYLLDAAGDIEFVLSELSKKSLSDWDDEEKRRAANVCSRMHLVGALAENGVIDADLMSKLWYYSIPRTRIVLDDFIKDKRSTRHKNYWSRFDWLFMHCQTVNSSTHGFDLPVGFSLVDPFQKTEAANNAVNPSGGSAGS